MFKMRILRSLTLALLMTLAACQAVGTAYKRPEANLPADFSESAGNQPQSLQAVNATWWRHFYDDTLNRLVENALENNTDIRLAVARIKEAQAYATEIGAATLPSVDFNTSANRNRVTASGPFPVFGNNPRNNFNYQLGANFELDFWGKLASAKTAARAQLLASQFSKQTVAISIASLVAQHYIELRSVESRMVILQDSLRSREDSLVLTKHRLEGGVVSALDVHQAEVAVANLNAQINEFQRQRGISLHQLATLTGELDLKLPIMPVDATKMALPIPPVPPAGLPSSLLENRPDIRQAEALLIAQHANMNNAKAALYPSIGLTASFGGESLALSDILKSASRIWTGGINLNIPIFNAGKLDAKVEQATARQQQALVQYETSLQTAFQEVNDALINLRQYAKQASAYHDSETAAKKVVAISKNRYEIGYSSFLEVLDAQRVYNDAALNAVASQEARLIASIALFKALGGGWTEVKAP